MLEAKSNLKVEQIRDKLRETLPNLIVPIYNEGENTRVLYYNLLEDGVDFNNLFFVYDLDDDNSLPIINKLSKLDSRVKPIKNEFGPGVLNALKFGFSLSSSGPLVVLMGDNSDKLSIIPDMILLWREGATIVSPSRYMKGGSQEGGGVIKSFLSRLAGTSLNFLGFPISDPTNNFKLYDSNWLSKQNIESKAGFELAIELCFKAFKGNEKIIELPTSWTDREEGESKFKLLAWLPHYLKWYFLSLAEIINKKFFKFNT